MDINEFKARLKSGNIGGCYIFAGEEDYLKRYYLSELRRAAVPDETLAAFNYAVFEGAEINFAKITDAVKAPPVFAEYKLIEWKYPCFDKMKDAELTLLEDTLDLLSDYPGTVLAFIVSEGDLELSVGKKESKFEKRFKDKAFILNLTVSTDAQLMSWLKKHFDAMSVSVSAEVLRELIFHAGHSMSTLSLEVDKLAYLALSRGLSAVSVDMVRDAASRTPECDTFALSNAVLERNKQGAYLALMEMKSRRLDPLMILGMLEKSYTELLSIISMRGDGMLADAIASALKINPKRLSILLAKERLFTKERLSRILSELVRVDEGMKFGGVSGYTALELFIGKCV